ncbi:hypothetical protein [Ralstonia pseudosolanacearum]|uniref:hypothetical protein n=1 Tax=Ralstonia pseudosolanacearum TaxID=1310165 RepID=UPI0013C2EAA7|nr:hypothetical protein [Ralstonia pseudosolanacearum]NKA02527.1 hypothetical protein [Ralstonia solanacearum]NKA54802.1 hypothetical protein [Ralstonia solanacearum]NKA70065.1 hypothetical protein [Ralstonia solanacearum]NKA85158.1 hypothetical protein [Ralstonia solanacearum]NKF56505.1 hypothetical protein [Ralstonia solanacearum]
MIGSLDPPNGTPEVRTTQRSDRRWFSEYRFTPNDGRATGWAETAIPEGFIASGIAFSAGLLLGQQCAEFAR